MCSDLFVSVQDTLIDEATAVAVRASGEIGRDAVNNKD